MNEKQIREAVEKISGIFSMVASNDDAVNGRNEIPAKKALVSLVTDLVAQTLVDLHRIADAAERLANMESTKVL